MKEDAIHVEFNNLSFNSMDSNCGIFVGNNSCNLWSSHSKSNSGLGTVSNGDIKNTLNVVFDNDGIDTVINDNDCVTLINKKYKESTSETNINLSSINVNAVDTNSTIAIGENDQNVWSTHSKENAGVGEVKGQSFIEKNYNFVDDRDVIDSPVSNTKTISLKPL